MYVCSGSGVIIQPAGGVGGGQSRATGRVDSDAQPLASSSEVSSKGIGSSLCMVQLLVALLVDGGKLPRELVADLLLLGDGCSLSRGDALKVLSVAGVQLHNIGAQMPALGGPAEGQAEGEQQEWQ